MSARELGGRSRQPSGVRCRSWGVALAIPLAVFTSVAPSSGQPAWMAAGPEVIRNGQTEGIGGAVPNPVIGGVKVVLPVPGEPDQMLLGTVNGGIWRTTNLSNAAGPTWTLVTPNATFPAAGTVTPLSTGAIAFTRNDATRAYTGLGLFSSFLQWGTALGGPPTLAGPPSPIALLRSTDAGSSWSPVNFTAGNGLSNVNISAVQSRGSNVVVVTGRRDTYYGTIPGAQRGLWRSSNADNPAATFTNLATGTGNASGLPVGDYTDLVNGPGNLSLMYTAVVNTPTAAEAGIYRSTDAGQTWSPVLTATTAPALPANTQNIRLAGRDGLADPQTIYAAIVTAAPQGYATPFNARVTQVARFADSGFGAPTVALMTAPGDADGGVNPGGQGILNVSISGDPTNTNVVYVGGDRQPGSPFAVCSGDAMMTCNPAVMPDPCVTAGKGACTVVYVCSGDATMACNPAAMPDACVTAGKGSCVVARFDQRLPNRIGANNYTGRLFRGTFDPGTGNTTWVPITHSGTANASAPHADSRSLAFVGGTLYEADDGGIYPQSNPSNNTGVWSARIGSGLQITEVYGVAFDRIARILLGSDQDTGAVQQSSVDGKTYNQIPTAAAGLFLSGDGGVVLVDNVSQAGAGRSVRYASSAAVANMQRAVYDAGNNPVGAPAFLGLNKMGGGKLSDGTERFAKTPAPFVLNSADTMGKRMVVGTAGQAGACNNVAQTPCCSNAPCGGATMCAGARAGAVWESKDSGDNFSQVGAGTLAACESVTAVISGGRKGEANDAEVLFAGTDAGAIYRRTAAAPLARLVGYAGGVPWDLALDTEDWSHLFVVDLSGNQIWRSLNADDPNAAAVAFTDITGNLLAVAGARFRAMTIEYANGLVVVGGLGGVYSADATAANPVWSLLGTGLPNAIVMDLTADSSTGSLFAGTLGRGIWALPSNVTHFKCYKVKPKNPFTPRNALPLEDQFGPRNMDVRRVKTLCLPANKRNEEPNAPLDPHHLEAYQVKASAGSPKFVKQTNLKVVNQFGTLLVDAVKPGQLFVPTGESLFLDPAPLPPPPNPDHFVCYKVKVARGAPAFVPLLAVPVADQFGTETVDVKKPTRLCNPANANGEDPTALAHPTHLMCYQVKDVAGSPKFLARENIFVNNEFGPATLTAVKPEELCVPSSKIVAATTTTTTTTTSSTTTTTSTSTSSTLPASTSTTTPTSTSSTVPVSSSSSSSTTPTTTSSTVPASSSTTTPTSTSTTPSSTSTSLAFPSGAFLS